MVPKLLLIVLVILNLIIKGHSTLRENLRPPHNKVVVCYVASWATYRQQRGSFKLENLRPELCTHLVYAFAGLNTTSWTIKSLDSWLDTSDDYGLDNYRKMTALRLQYPSLRVSIAIGGWNEGSINYSLLSNSKEKRYAFVNSVLAFLKKYNFDGLDLDWEFPAKRGGSPNDKENFVLLVQELSSALKKHGYILTAAISADKSTIDAAYNIPEISKHLDYIHVMSYDYHGAWNSRVLANAPLACNDGLCVKETIEYLIAKGTPKDKLVLGIPMYGRTFVLVSTPTSNNINPIGLISLDKGFKGPYTLEDGFMGYNEICDALRNKTAWTVGWDDKSSVPYAINKDHVIIYDNPRSVKLKVEYARKINLAGIMVWAIDNDDFLGDCANQHTDILDTRSGIDFPLMRTINQVLSEKKDTDNEIDPDNNKENGNSAAINNLSIYNFFNVMIVYIIFLINNYN